MFYKREKIELSERSREVYNKLIDPNSDLVMIKKEFDFSFIYNQIKKNYCLNDGRNSIDGVIALRAIFLQKYFSLSERGLERKAKFDIEIKNFLDIEIDEEAFEFTTIWNFKKMLGEQKTEDIFNTILKQIKSKGIIKTFRRQAIDTIPILAAAALPCTICLIYQAIRDVCDNVNEIILKEIFSKTELTSEKLENYAKVHPLFGFKEEDKMKSFQTAAKQGFTILEIIREYNLASEEINILKEILQENTKHVKEEEFTQKYTPHSKKSLVDKDATVGHKTEEKIVFGYKAGVSVVQEGIITAYEVTPMSYRDDEHLIPLLEKQEQNGVKCEEADADSAFGFIQNYVDAESKDIILHSPLRDFDPEKLSVYDFKYDAEKHELTCSNNVIVKGRNSGALTFDFNLRTCRTCPKIVNCPLAPSKVATLNENHEAARRAIIRQREDKEKNKQDREAGRKNFKRLVVENVFAFLEKLGVKETPAYSLEMTKVHVGITATLSNMLKTVRLIRGRNQPL